MTANLLHLLHTFCYDHCNIASHASMACSQRQHKKMFAVSCYDAEAAILFLSFWGLLSISELLLARSSYSVDVKGNHGRQTDDIYLVSAAFNYLRVNAALM